MTTKPFPSELRYWGTGRCAAYVKIGPGELDYERELAGCAYASVHLTPPPRGRAAGPVSTRLTSACAVRSL
ncbi:hypothetical protein ADK60_03120 [Streptomyces sp. XY431]|uniref:hypothetical protein n=1 Tax=Streptomyces sp. XY431 TaxID=1415562 RepID=UPI0006AF6494|nr:hypothetical protein [Streptomyces sp. XY431]KOV38008.1 hypothetical protein ADK60_03120 [Streptomyces sp. XY431]